MKYEWKKNEKNLYGVKQKPQLIEIPSAYYIMIKGEGNPNESDFSNRVSALYSLAYGIKMLFKNMEKEELEYSDFTNFSKVIKKAEIACKKSGQATTNHFS